jgi:hypothetical protein
MMALAQAAAAHQRAGDDPGTRDTLTQVHGFAHRNQAPGLLRLTSPTATSALPDPGPIHAA